MSLDVGMGVPISKMELLLGLGFTDDMVDGEGRWSGTGSSAGLEKRGSVLAQDRLTREAGSDVKTPRSP